MVTFGLGAFLLAPLSSYYLFNDLKFWKYYRYFYPMIKACLRLARMWLTSEAYRKSFAIDLKGKKTRRLEYLIYRQITERGSE